MIGIRFGFSNYTSFFQPSLSRVSKVDRVKVTIDLYLKARKRGMKHQDIAEKVFNVSHQTIK